MNPECSSSFITINMILSVLSRINVITEPKKQIIFKLTVISMFATT